MDILVISILILLGLFFCVVELLILPGVTLGGILAASCYGGAIYMGFKNLGTIGGIIVVIVAIVLSLVAIIYSLRAKTWDKLSLKSEIASSSSASPQKSLAIGDCGVAVSRLSPMGKIEVKGNSYEAKSSGTYIDERDVVEVIGFENYSVIVKKSDK